MESYQRPRSTRLLVITLLVTSLVVITVDFRSGDRGPLAAVGRVGVSIVTPLQKGLSAVIRPVGSFFTTLFRAGSLSEQNDQLRRQIEELTTSVPFVTALERENAELRRLVDLVERLRFDGFAATVIGNGVSNFEWVVNIDKGSQHGVFVGQPVITGSGVVGRVVKVAPYSATVMLIIDPQSRISVRLAGSGETGLLEGQREGDLRLALLDPDTEVVAGERVLTSGYRVPTGERGLFPPEIPVGVVSEVRTNETGFSVDVLVRPNVDFSALEHVYLIRPSEGPVTPTRGQ